MPAGPSILELVWVELDKVMDVLMAAKLGGELPEPERVGSAQGLALAIAILLNPYKPNINAVRVEAVNRWEGRQA